MVSIGAWQLESVVTGRFRLDGGAMFGVVPKVVWQKAAPPDELNRIPMTTRTLLAVNRAAGRIVLVDTGLGSKWEADAAARFAVECITDAFPQALARFGATTDDVTDVVVTHLHFDHCGGMTRYVEGGSGPVQLVFPQARHWLLEEHWRHAAKPTPRDRASFYPIDYEVLAGAPGLQLVKGPPPGGILPGVDWFVGNGHTPAQLLPIFRGGSDAGVLFVGDIVPTAAHLPPAWVMGYDLYPLTSLAEREEIYRRCQGEGLRLAFPHDPRFGIAALDFSTGKPRVAEQLA